MGKAERNRQRSARERIAAQQAAARKAEARRRAFLAFGSIIGVIAIVVVLLVIKGLGKPAKAAADAATSQNPVSKQVATIPATTFDSVGKGAATPLVVTKGTNPVLTSGGKPEIVYVGAEYCPYCAAERWALTAALSRFGTFSNLHYIHSSSTDVYPSTPTLTFYKSTYTSKYVDFEPVEIQGTTQGKALQTPTATQSGLFAKWDAPPYVPANEKGSFPFVDFGNQYLVLGAQYNPQDLAKPELGSGGGGHGQPHHQGRQRHRRRGELHHRGDLQDHEERPRRGVHLARRPGRRRVALMAGQKQGARTPAGKGGRAARPGQQNQAARSQAARNAGHQSTGPAADRRGTAAGATAARKGNGGRSTTAASASSPAPAGASQGAFRSMTALQWVILAITIYGLGASVYLTIAHFDTHVSLVCSGHGVINCEEVTTSSWSEVFGVLPVAVLGLAFYVFLTAANSPWAWRWQQRLPAIRWARLGSLVVGIVFVLYLIYAETQIGAICLWCTSVHVATFLLFCIIVFDAAYNWGKPDTAR